MATTQILPWAPNSSANIEPQSSYASDTNLPGGYPYDAILPSATLNKTLRQATFMAAGYANWMVLQGVNVPDDGNLSALVNNISLALSNFASGGTISGSFVNLSASGTVSGTGFTNYFASPPAIGSTAANTGAFTNLSSIGTVSGIGFSNYLNSPPVIGGGTANAGTFTTLSATTLNLTNQLAITYGGTNGSATPTAGAIAYGTGTAYGFSAAGTSSQVLLSGGTGSPTWVNQSSLAVGSATNIANGTLGALPYQTGSSATSFLSLGTSGYVLTAGASAPQYVAQSTLAVGKATNLAAGSTGSVVYQSASGTTAYLGLGSLNYVLTAGSSAPQYVAQSTLSVGSASNLVSGAAGSLPYQTGAGATTFLGLGTSGYVLTAGATAPQYVAQSTLSVGSATTATTSTNLAGGLAGSIPYQTGAGATSMIAAGTGVLVGGSTPTYSTTPTLTGTNFSGVPNGALVNSSITINGNSVSLGGSTTITAAAPFALTMNNSGSGAVSGTTYTGSSAITLSYNTIGASPLAGSTSLTTLGTVTTGTWNATPIGNSYLANSSITFGSTAQALGSTVTDISGVTIGNSSQAAGAFTALSASGQLTLTNASNYNVYASGAGANYFAGNVGIGSTSLTGCTLNIGKNISGAVTFYVANNSGVIQSDVTTSCQYFSAVSSTAASSFTLSEIRYFAAAQGTFGAGSNVSNQYGFIASPTLIGATSNYGFYSNIGSGTNRWNFYAGGSAPNYFAGAIGIGSTGLTAYGLNIGINATGATTWYGARAGSTVQSDVTVQYNGFYTGTSTAAASFTLPALVHYTAAQNTIGAGSTVTNQYGFNAGSSLTGATNNYGFYSNIASATNAYNFYAAGSAPNYLAGKLGIGGLPLTQHVLYIAGTIQGSGTNGQAVRIDSSIDSSATGSVRGFFSGVGAPAGTSATSIAQYAAYQGTYAGTVTSNYGFQADSTLTGATNNYGFYSNLASAPSGGTASSSVSTVASSSTTTTIVTVAAHGLSTGQVVTILLTANATALVSGVTCTILTVGTTDYTLIGAASNTVGLSFTATGAGTGTGTVTVNQQGSGKTITVVDTVTFTYTATSGTYTAITASGTITPSKRYNIYVNGTAPNYFAGNVGVNDLVPSGGIFYVGGSLSNNSGISLWSSGIIQSNVTTTYSAVSTYSISTAATPFTLANLNHFSAGQGTIGAGSSVTSQFGVNVASSLTGATNNYGFYSNIASSANRYNFYAAGTADNYFAGAVKCASTLGYTTGGGGAVTQATSRTTGVTLNKATGAITLFTAAGSTTPATFTVTNSTVAANDVIHVSQQTGANLYVILVTAVAAGSFNITQYTTGGTTSEAPIFNFAVIKGSAS